MSPDSIPAMEHQLLSSNMAPALTSLTEPTRIRFQKKTYSNKPWEILKSNYKKQYFTSDAEENLVLKNSLRATTRIQYMSTNRARRIWWKLGAHRLATTHPFFEFTRIQQTTKQYIIDRLSFYTNVTLIRKEWILLQEA